MKEVAALVPDFDHALEMLPGMPEAYKKLASSLEQGTLSKRVRAKIHLLVAGYIRCDYCQWVLSRVGENAGLTGEEILFSTIGTSRERRESAVLGIARRIVSGGVTAERVRLDELEARLFAEVELAEIAAHVALAVLTCSLLQAVAPGRVGVRGEA